MPGRSIDQRLSAITNCIGICYSTVHCSGCEHSLFLLAVNWWPRPAVCDSIGTLMPGYQQGASSLSFLRCSTGVRRSKAPLLFGQLTRWFCTPYDVLVTNRCGKPNYVVYLTDGSGLSLVILEQSVLRGVRNEFAALAIIICFIGSCLHEESLGKDFVAPAQRSVDPEHIIILVIIGQLSFQQPQQTTTNSEQLANPPIATSYSHVVSFTTPECIFSLRLRLNEPLHTYTA